MINWLYKGNKIENIEDFGEQTPFGFVYLIDGLWFIFLLVVAWFQKKNKNKAVMYHHTCVRCFNKTMF